MDDDVRDLSWSEVESAIGRIAARFGSTHEIDLIVGISRGGLVPAVLLAHQLRVDQVCSVSARITLSDVPHSDRRRVPEVSMLPGGITAQRALLVDDVVGTGRTLAAVRAVLHCRGIPRIEAAVVYQNTANRTSAVPEDLFAALTGVAWMRFPWEPPIHGVS